MEVRTEAPKRKNELAIEALDALGLALADHGHKWSDRERQLYEAVTTASSARQAGASPLADAAGEVVVTSEMRRAGAIALDACRGSASEEEVAEAVYTAMAALAPR